MILGSLNVHYIGAFVIYDLCTMDKTLIIQTAFIGDVILATAVIEKLRMSFPDMVIDFLLRKGNESLLDGHPHLRKVIIWNKNKGKYTGLIKVVKEVRREKYERVINLQRYFSTGLISFLSGANSTIGFDKNPLSFLFTKSITHQFGTIEKPMHEVGRNLSLIGDIVDNQLVRPKLYPSTDDFRKVETKEKYITISPGSIWFTKQWPHSKWVDFLNRVGESHTVFLLGGKQENALCQKIKNLSQHKKIEIRAGEYSFLQSAALMKSAEMNYVNDSAPLHLASSINAPVTAVFCSTVKEFGFTPLSDNQATLETNENLNCRPCGLHGKTSCPQGHFRCSNIEIERLLDRLK